MATKLGFEVELKSSAEKIWKSIGEFATLYPKAFPDVYRSVEVLEGDGSSAGSIRVVNFAPGLSGISSTTEKIESVDEENKTMSYAMIEGDILKYYNNFKATLCVSLTSHGSIVKLSAQFDEASEEGPGPDLYREFFVTSFRNLDAHLLKA